MSEEARFTLSHDYTTIRAYNYEELLANMKEAFGAEAENILAVAFSNMRNHYLGIPSEAAAVSALQAGVGAVVQPASPAAPSGAWVALDIPFSQKDYAKNSGGKWDNSKKAWTFPPGHALISQFPVKS